MVQNCLSLTFASSLAISTVLNNLIILAIIKVCFSLYKIGSLLLLNLQKKPNTRNGPFSRIYRANYATSHPSNVIYVHTAYTYHCSCRDKNSVQSSKRCKKSHGKHRKMCVYIHISNTYETQKKGLENSKQKRKSNNKKFNCV